MTKEIEVRKVTGYIVEAGESDPTTKRFSALSKILKLRTISRCPYCFRLNTVLMACLPGHISRCRGCEREYEILNVNEKTENDK